MSTTAIRSNNNIISGRSPFSISIYVSGKSFFCLFLEKKVLWEQNFSNIWEIWKCQGKKKICCLTVVSPPGMMNRWRFGDNVNSWIQHDSRLRRRWKMYFKRNFLSIFHTCNRFQLTFWVWDSMSPRTEISRAVATNLSFFFSVLFFRQRQNFLVHLKARLQPFKVAPSFCLPFQFNMRYMRVSKQESSKKGTRKHI